MTRSSNMADIQNVAIHYVEEKPENPKKLLILLHGFPQYWYAWKAYLPKFSQRGFHVVAPDLRGYNESDKPEKKACYDINYVIKDILELIRHLGYKSATVMGHDWGGSVTWELAEHHPDMLNAAVIVNAPHRGVFAQKIRSEPFFNLRQIVRSWYILFFQLPYLPERMVQNKDFRWLENIFRSITTRTDAFTDKDIEAYKAAFRKPGALTAAINYYRANATGHFGKDIIRAAAGKKHFGTIHIPTLLLWGDQDPPLDIQLSDNVGQFVSGPFKKVHLEQASHWILHEYPQWVMAEIDEFFNEIS